MEIEVVKIHPVARWLHGLQDQPVVWRLFAALALAGQLADILTTLAFLHAGASEHNQIGARLMGLGEAGWPLLIAAKLLLALALGWVLLAVAAASSVRRSRVGAVILLLSGAFVIGWWAIIGWNVAVWLVVAHALPWSR